MTEPEMPKGAQSQANASVWQWILVLPALGSVGIGVLLPLSVLAVLFSTALSLAWCGKRIEQLAFPSQELMVMAAMISAVLVLGGFGAATWVRLQEALHPSAETEPSRARRGWLLRHPWWTLGLGLLVADMLLWRAPSGHPLGAASVLLAESSWFILTATWLVWRLFWGSLGLGWRWSRSSSFMAGLVVATGLFTATGWLIFFQAAEELARAARPALSRAVEQSRSLRGWSPSSLGASSSEATAAPVVPALFEHQQHGALTPGLLVRFGDPEEGDPDEAAETAASAPSAAISDCMLGLDSQLQSEAIAQAGRFVDSYEAQDVVKDVLIRVCLHGKAPALAPGYFIRSVQNRAREWKRRAARVCNLAELPEPRCALRPDEDYLREEQSRAVNKALCSLSEDEQEVLRLRYFEQEDYAQIARGLGISEAAARQRVSRALRELRAALQEKCL